MGRFKNHPKKEKMNELAERTSTGNLSSFSGVFQTAPISEHEEASLRHLLEKYQTEENDLSTDLKSLSTITSEVRAISNQAVILHGERIKRAQALFKNYREGAFSQWLLTTYGNRQTPYNFLQYYELHHSLPKKLQGILDEMPRQAIYSLSSRSASLEQKEAFIEEYKGESKAELLEKLRTSFPLTKQDKRNPNKAKMVYNHLTRALKGMGEVRFEPTEEERETLKALAQEILAKL